MSVSARVLIEVDELVARVNRLIVIGQALNLSSSWGDDLTEIRGVGPVYAAAFRRWGITTFEVVAALDDVGMAQVLASVHPTRHDTDKWRSHAKSLAASAASPEGQALAADADWYLSGVQQCRGYVFDGRGLVEFVWRKQEKAVPGVIDILSAPVGHRRSLALSAALRTLLADEGGVARIPFVASSDIDELSVIQRSLEEHRSLTDDLVRSLESIGDRTGFDFTAMVGS